MIDCDDTDCSADPNCLIVGTEICSDGGDNDGDGDIDCADSDCANSTCCSGIPVNFFECDCTDGFDNNGSNGTDCADPACAIDQVVKVVKRIVPTGLTTMETVWLTVQIPAHLILRVPVPEHQPVRLLVPMGWTTIPMV